jgi:hypothetical protein
VPPTRAGFFALGYGRCDPRLRIEPVLFVWRPGPSGAHDLGNQILVGDVVANEVAHHFPGTLPRQQFRDTLSPPPSMERAAENTLTASSALAACLHRTSGGTLVVDFHFCTSDGHALAPAVGVGADAALSLRCRVSCGGRPYRPLILCLNCFRVASRRAPAPAPVGSSHVHGVIGDVPLSKIFVGAIALLHAHSPCSSGSRAISRGSFRSLSTSAL